MCMQNETRVREYIKNNWNITKDESGYIPYPFVPPSVSDGFNILFYWDTFFTNEGLLADGKITEAKYNVDNLLYFLDKHGFVPNFTSPKGAELVSQPPYLFLMVKRLYQLLDDKEWAKYAFSMLEKEYVFWMNNRSTPCGLNRYGTVTTQKNRFIGYYRYLSTRLDLPQDITDDEKVHVAKHFMAEAESGEDFTPRFSHKAQDFAPVCLNTLLYGLEQTLAEYYAGKDEEKHEKYARAAAVRAERMQAVMRDEDGVYHDYNVKMGKRSDIYAAACFLPYAFGLTRDGIEKLAEKLGTKNGFVTCENVGELGYQWGYPHIWAPHQYWGFQALLSCGKTELAKEYAIRYLRLITRAFEQTGRLWEKYDIDGVAYGVEYKNQIMLGWTAGMFNVLYDKFIGE